MPTLAMFDGLVGATFRAHTGGGDAVDLRLVEATALPPTEARADLPIRKDPFSLVFRAEPAQELSQGIYHVDHPESGSTDMFLVPVGFGEYQAIFN
jgi:hypothetical protein